MLNWTIKDMIELIALLNHDTQFKQDYVENRILGEYH